nr:gustatory receptor for sugar taste 64a-like [Aedes albopictus]
MNVCPKKRNQRSVEVVDVVPSVTYAGVVKEVASVQNDKVAELRNNKVPNAEDIETREENVEMREQESAPGPKPEQVPIRMWRSNGKLYAQYDGIAAISVEDETEKQKKRDLEYQSPPTTPFSDILTGQIFGIFPLSGIFNEDPSRVRLVWSSLRVILDLIVLGAGIVNSIAECMRLQMVGVNAKNINGLIFFIDGCIINVLFLQMATKWNRVVVKWDSVDRIFLTESYRIESKWTLKRRLWTATALLLGLACCEHLLASVNNLYDQLQEIEHCGWKENITDNFRHFSLRKFSNMYSFVPYSTASALFFMVSI